LWLWEVAAFPLAWMQKQICEIQKLCTVAED